MEENQILQNSSFSLNEPDKGSDNLNNENPCECSNSVSQNEGKSTDPSELILGKFKSTDDLTKAYQQLEKLQGNQSSELGTLREKVTQMNNLNSAFATLTGIMKQVNTFDELSQKHKEYFEDPSFRKLASEAYLALGDNFDPEKLINLVESYVSARIFAYEKSKTAKNETKENLNGMTFDKNDKNVKSNVRKSIQQMTPKELDALLDELI